MKWLLCETIKSGESLMRHSSRRTINKRGGSIADHKALTIRGATLWAKDSPVKPSCLLRARWTGGVIQLCLVQRDQATLCRQFECMDRVRSTRLWKSENWDTRVIGQHWCNCCVKGVSRYGTANPYLCDCYNMWTCDAYHLGYTSSPLLSLSTHMFSVL